MSDTNEKAENEHETDHEPSASHQSEYATERMTAPQSPYTSRDVTMGALVAVIGMAVVFGVPLLLT